MKRIIHDNDYMQFVMTPPQQTEAKYDMYRPSVSTMRIVSNGGGQGLGEVSVVGSGSGGDQQSWVMPVVIIVVSAMALMTLYAVLSKR